MGNCNEPSVSEILSWRSCLIDKSQTTPSAGRDDSLTVLAQQFQPKKGRPTAAQVAAIDRSILLAATERFLIEGYAGASMDAISLAAGVSKGTLYSRYPNKESLFRAVVTERIEAWSAEAEKQDWKRGDTLEARLKHYAKLAMSHGVSAESRAFDRLFNGALGVVAPEILQMLYRLRYGRGLRYLTREIREFTRAEGSPARNPRRVASTLMAALAGWLRVEASLRVVSEREAVNFGYRTVELLISGRLAW
jgi:TetR/AcrR family transcriptional repressor of mexJK operon